MELSALSRFGTNHQKPLCTSELKALEGVYNKIETFYQDGNFVYSKDGQEFKNNGFKRDWEDFENVKDNENQHCCH